MPEALPHQASEPVSPDRQSDFLFGNRETQARSTQGVLVEKDSKKAICRTLAVLEHLVEIRGVQQAQLPREVLSMFPRMSGG